MKHLIGGFALGFFIGLAFLEPCKEKPMGCVLFGSLLAVAAWGLLP